MLIKTRLLLLLSVFCLNVPIHAQTQIFIPVPDAAETTNSFDYGPTGLKIRLEPPSYTIRVTGIVAGSPADGLVSANQIIDSINGVSLSGSADPRITLGDIITDAEATDGALNLQIQGAGLVTVNIPVLGAYSATWPVSCPKSDAIVDDLATLIASQASPDAGSIIFLLSTGDPTHLPVIANWVANTGSLGTYPWSNGLRGLGMCEYYLQTGDPNALALIQEGANNLRDLMYAGGWSGRGHASFTYGPGSGHLNAAGAPALSFLLMAKLCGVDVDETTLQDSLEHFYRYVGHDNLSYGNSVPEGGFRDNGKTSALAFAMQAATRLDPDGENSVYAAARDISAIKAFYANPWFNRSHPGGGIGEMWHAMAMGLMADVRPEQYRNYMDARRWHFELSRDHEGGMGICHTNSPSHSFDKSTGDGWDWGTFYALAYTIPRKNLIIFGAPLTLHCEPYDLPERPWGTEADETFYSLRPAMQPNGDVTELSYERVGTHDSAAYGSLLAAAGTTDVTLVEFAHHIDQGIRSDAAKNIVAKGRSNLLLPLLQSDEPRVRHAGLLTITGMFKGSPFALGDISAAAIQEVEDMLEDPDESLWVRLHAARALARFDVATVAAHKTTLLAMLDHDDWWVQEAAARALKVIVAEEDHYLDVIPAMAKFCAEARVVATLWGYGWEGSDLMSGLRAAPSHITDFAAEHFTQEHADNPVFMQGPGGKVVTYGATYTNNMVGEGADSLLGAEPYPRAMTLSTPTYRITLDPADQIDYDGQFIHDPALATTWEYATRLSDLSSFPAALGSPTGSGADITFADGGFVDGEPGVVWTEGYYIDLFRREAREIIKAKDSGLYYLIIERGTFDIGANPNQYWHPGYDVYVRKLADMDEPTPDPMTFALTPTGTDPTTVSMTAATAIDGSYPVEYYIENTTNSDFRGWSTDPTWNNTGLAPGAYGYRVKARDGEGNETAWSSVVNGSPGDDSSAPFPDPMDFQRPPTAKAADSITMTATTAYDLNGVEYYFECTVGGGPDSGWQAVPVYTPTGLTTGQSYTYVVRARDSLGNTTADSSPASATPQAVTDVTPPLVAVLEPASGAGGIAPGTSLVMTFDEEVVAGTGSIIIKNLTEGIETAIAITDGQIVISGSTVTITPTGGLIEGRTYAVRIAEGVLADTAANSFAGLLNDNAWRFTIADINPPLVQSLSPADETAGVSPTGDLQITFDEPVAAGTGHVTIKNLDDVTQTQIDITDGSQITVTGSTLIINPTLTLEAGTRFAVQISATAIDDLAGNSFAGITDDTTWNFDTWANAVLTTDNPLVPSSLTVGETFQIAFVTSSVLQRDLLDGSDDGSDDSDISQWNSWVNDQAAASVHATSAADIAELSWNAIASTTLVAARDNALVSGPVYRIDRNQVATGFADMWDASLINAIEVDENGTLQSGNVWAGGPSYSSDGTIGGQPLGNGTTGASRGAIGTNHTWFGQGGHISRGPDDAQTRVYALSEVISVAADATPPAISTLSPADDATGVAIGADLVVRFSETISSGSGNIVLKNLTDGAQTSIPITDVSQVTISGSELIINPTANFLLNKDYAVQIDSGAIQDTTGNAFAGISDDTTWNFNTVPAPDTSPPSIVALSPEDDTVSAAVDADLVIMFDENIVAGTGNVTVKNLTDATEITIAITDGTQVAISGNILTINPTADLEFDANYSVHIDAGAIEDTVGNAFEGITANWAWSFSTLDLSAPIMLSLSPPDDSQNIPLGTNLTITFDEYILPGTGLVTLKNLTDATESTIDISDGSQVSFLGKTVEINPTSDLALHKEYAIQIAGGAIEDLFGNGFAGMTDDTTWNFDTFDNSPPSIIALSPHVTASVAVDTDLVATFDEPIVAGTGDITVKNLTDATEVTIDVTDGSQVSISGSILTINPTSNLETDKNYAIQISTTAIEDLFGNDSTGITDDSGWNFSTVVTPKFLDASHPMVPAGFGPGDTIQFAFVTSGQVQRDLLDGSDDGSDDSAIYHWNVWVNDQAAASTHPTAASEIARFNWRAIASTKDVDARDNALVSGPVYRLDGELVANDLTDMWDGSLSNAISIDEDGGTQSGYLWSGSSSGGISNSLPLGDGTANATRGSIGTGGNWFTNGGHLSRGPNSSERVYALSDVITLVDGDPVIATLSPADDATAVAIGDDLVVTFNEAIAAGSGLITIKNLTDGTQTTINITDGSQVTISGAELTIDPTTDLAANKQYAIRIDGTAIDDLAGNGFAGIADDTTWNFATELQPDTTPPSIVALDPPDDSVDVALGANLVVTFDEDIAVGSGSITIKNLSDGTQDTIDINDAQITVSGAELTINPTADLTGDKQYAIQIDGTAIGDLAGNGFAGIADDTTWNFATTLPGDTTPPSIVTLDPADDSSDVALATDLTVTFDENISSGTGTITLKNLTDVTQSVIDVDDAQVSISGGVLTISPTSDLEFGKNYAVQISSGAIQDTAGNAFAGINDDTTWNFSTVLPPDTTPPSIVTLEPADDSVDVALGANLVVTFDEDIAVGSGSVTLKNLSDGTQDTIDINDAQVTISGTQLTINPALNLVLGKQYAVQIANTAIEDLSGNAFAGIADDGTWNFTTVLAQGNTLEPGHPLIPAGLGPGDSFQLVFVTSTKVQADDVDGTDDGTDNTTVAHWNNHVNSVAGASTLQVISNLTWYAIVSVDDDASGPNVGVAAVDNAVVSAPVYRTDGTLIATGFADFWDSNLLAPIKWNENGVEQNTQGGSASGRQVWTGSTGTGAIDARPLGYPLSNTGNYSIRMGNADATGDDWINTSDATRRSPTSSGRVYALSEVITVAGAGGGVPTEDDNTVSASGFASTMVFDPSGGAGLNGMVSGSFAGFSGGSYTVEWSPDLVTPFAPVPGMSWPVEGAGTSGTGGDQIPWSHETGGATRAFYRLKIE